MRRGVKAGLTNLRWRWWSGGSRKRIDSAPVMAPRSRSDGSTPLPEQKVAGSREMRMMSSWRATLHKSQSSCHCTGASARSRANTG